MKTFKSIIIEDEKLAVENLQSELEELSYIDIVAISDDLEEAEKLILFHKPDILFLDIMVNGETVFTLLKKLEEWNLTFGIVFITAHHDQYLLDAVESCGLKYKFAYLGKPVHPPKLIGKLNELRKELLQDSDEEEENSITLQFQGGLLRLLYDEIFYCETSGNNSIIHTTDEGREVFIGNLSELEKKLPSRYFYRMSGQYIINRHYFRKAKTSNDHKRLCILQVGLKRVTLHIPTKRWSEFKHEFGVSGE